MSGNMKSLPSDVLLEILSRVPYESVSECKLVSKKWNTLIVSSGSHFTKMHFSRQLQRLYDNDGNNDDIAANEEVSLLFACQTDTRWNTSLFYGGNFSDSSINTHEKYSYTEEFKKVCHPPLHKDYTFPYLVGSCDGLVCLYMRHDKVCDPIYVFNPVTKEEVYLPELVVKEGMGTKTSCGFGYISLTSEYKIVRIHYPFHPHKGQIQVYTLGSGYGWRDKGMTSQGMDTGIAGTHVNGTIYWLGVDSIGAFDLADEVFRLIPLPLFMDNWMDDAPEKYGLVSFGGCLCLYHHGQQLKIWSFKKKCSETKGSWCLQFDIEYEDVIGSLEGELVPMLLTKKNEIILLFDYSALYCYDPRTTTLRMLSNDDAWTDFEAVKAIPYIQTFASLRAIGEICVPEIEKR